MGQRNGSIWRIGYGSEGSWRKENGKIIYEISIPVGTKAQIYLPVKADKITENGLPIAKVNGIKTAEEKDGCVLINIGLGKIVV